MMRLCSIIISYNSQLLQGSCAEVLIFLQAPADGLPIGWCLSWVSQHSEPLARLDVCKIGHFHSQICIGIERGIDSLGCY